MVASSAEADDDQRPCRRPGTASSGRCAVMIRPLTMLETSSPPTIAIDIRPASVGRHAAGELEVLAEVDRRAEHREPDQHRGGGRQGRGAVAEQPQRDDRLAGDPRLDVDGAGEHDRGRRHEQPTLVVEPQRELSAGQRHPHQQHRDAADEQGRAEVVDVHLAASARAGAASSGAPRTRARRPAGPRRSTSASRPGVDEQAADQRAADGREGERRADVAGVAAALARADHAWRSRPAPARSGRRRRGPGPRGRRSAPPSRARGPATSEPTEKMTSADCTSTFLLNRSASLPQIGRGRRHRQQRGDDDPGVAGLAALEVGHDPRQCVRDDGAGEHRDEHRQQQAAEGLEDLAVRHLRPTARRGGRRGLGHGVSIHAERRLTSRATIFLGTGPSRKMGTTRRRGRRNESRRPAPVDVVTGSPAGRVTAWNSPAASGCSSPRCYWLLAGSHLTRPRRIHSSDHLLSRVAPR